MKWLFAVVMLMLATACIPIEQNGGRVHISQGSDGELSAVNIRDVIQQTTLRAMVKGSIYSTGEQISLYGTCLDQDDTGYVGSYSTFAAWYPNGTQMFTGTAGTEIVPGYFIYSAPMSAVQGTYLTEFTCHVNGSSVVAKAFGEWQNPMWVKKISDTLVLANQTNITTMQIANYSNMTLAQVEAASYQLALMYNLSYMMNQTLAQMQAIDAMMPGYFNQTWNQINSSTVMLNTSITTTSNYVAQVANGSVDRNDSYLAKLMQQMAASEGIPSTGVLTWIQGIDKPKYFTTWHINLRVYDEYNKSVDDSKVGCHISTDNSPTTVNASFSYVPTGTSSLLNDGITGYWAYSEKINKISDFTWSVTCAYK
jgi:hypothetical protein